MSNYRETGSFKTKNDEKSVFFGIFETYYGKRGTKMGGNGGKWAGTDYPSFYIIIPLPFPPPLGAGEGVRRHCVISPLLPKAGEG